jgi:hypothetical protein
MVCRSCNGKPNDPGTYAADRNNCDGRGFRDVCGQCLSVGMKQTIVNFDMYQSPYHPFEVRLRETNGEQLSRSHILAVVAPELVTKIG